jgi:hypothetical protein
LQDGTLRGYSSVGVAGWHGGVERWHGGIRVLSLRSWTLPRVSETSGILLGACAYCVVQRSVQRSTLTVVVTVGDVLLRRPTYSWDIADPCPSSCQKTAPSPLPVIHLSE